MFRVTVSVLFIFSLCSGLALCQESSMPRVQIDAEYEFSPLAKVLKNEQYGNPALGYVLDVATKVAKGGGDANDIFAAARFAWLRYDSTKSYLIGGGNPPGHQPSDELRDMAKMVDLYAKGTGLPVAAASSVLKALADYVDSTPEAKQAVLIEALNGYRAMSYDEMDTGLVISALEAAMNSGAWGDEQTQGINETLAILLGSDAKLGMTQEDLESLFGLSSYQENQQRSPFEKKCFEIANTPAGSLGTDSVEELRQLLQQEFERGRQERSENLQQQQARNIELDFERSLVNTASMALSLAGNDDLAKKVAVVGNALIKGQEIYEQFKKTQKLMEGAENAQALMGLAGAVATMNYMALAGAVISVFMNTKSPEQIIMEMIQDLTNEVREFREYMTARLDVIDNKLDRIQREMTNQFGQLDLSLRAMQNANHAERMRITREIRAIYTSIERLQTDLVLTYQASTNVAIDLGSNRVNHGTYRDCLQLTNRIRRGDVTAASEKFVVEDCAEDLVEYATFSVDDAARRGGVSYYTTLIADPQKIHALLVDPGVSTHHYDLIYFLLKQWFGIQRPTPDFRRYTPIALLDHQQALVDAYPLSSQRLPNLAHLDKALGQYRNFREISQRVGALAQVDLFRTGQLFDLASIPIVMNESILLADRQADSPDKIMVSGILGIVSQSRHALASLKKKMTDAFVADGMKRQSLFLYDGDPNNNESVTFLNRAGLRTPKGEMLANPRKNTVENPISGVIEPCQTSVGSFEGVPKPLPTPGGLHRLYTTRLRTAIALGVFDKVRVCYYVQWENDTQEGPYSDNGGEIAYTDIWQMGYFIMRFEIQVLPRGEKHWLVYGVSDFFDPAKYNYQGKIRRLGYVFRTNSYKRSLTGQVIEEYADHKREFLNVEAYLDDFWNQTFDGHSYRIAVFDVNFSYNDSSGNRNPGDAYRDKKMKEISENGKKRVANFEKSFDIAMSDPSQRETFANAYEFIEIADIRDIEVAYQLVAAKQTFVARFVESLYPASAQFDNELRVLLYGSAEKKGFDTATSEIMSEKEYIDLATRLSQWCFDYAKDENSKAQVPPLLRDDIIELKRLYRLAG